MDFGGNDRLLTTVRSNDEQNPNPPAASSTAGTEGTIQVAYIGRILEEAIWKKKCPGKCSYPLIPPPSAAELRTEDLQRLKTISKSSKKSMLCRFKSKRSK